MGIVVCCNVMLSSLDKIIYIKRISNEIDPRQNSAVEFTFMDKEDSNIDYAVTSDSLNVPWSFTLLQSSMPLCVFSIYDQQLSMFRKSLVKNAYCVQSASSSNPTFYFSSNGWYIIFKTFQNFSHPIFAHMNKIC